MKKTGTIEIPAGAVGLEVNVLFNKDTLELAGVKDYFKGWAFTVNPKGKIIGYSTNLKSSGSKANLVFKALKQGRHKVTFNVKSY